MIQISGCSVMYLYVMVLFLSLNCHVESNDILSDPNKFVSMLSEIIRINFLSKFQVFHVLNFNLT